LYIIHKYQLAAYSRNVPPSVELRGGLLIFLKQILNIDDKEQLMTSSFNLYGHWYDFRLAWNPTDYRNLTGVLILGFF
jgi:hypothetical protein